MREAIRTDRVQRAVWGPPCVDRRAGTPQTASKQVLASGVGIWQVGKPLAGIQICFLGAFENGHCGPNPDQEPFEARCCHFGGLAAAIPKLLLETSGNGHFGPNPGQEPF